MIDSIKNKIANYVVNKKYFQHEQGNVVFNNFVRDSIDYLFLMPSNDADFNTCFEIVKYFVIHKKNVTLLLPEVRYNTVPEKHKYKLVAYSLEDMTKLKLPDNDLLERLNRKSFDVTIDLNRDDNLFFETISSVVKSKYKVGFEKKNSDKCYNFQIPNKEINSEISYKNLLNSLLMF